MVTAIREFRGIIDFINLLPSWENIKFYQDTVGRIFRELGVTRLRAGASYIGENEVEKGLQLAFEFGKKHDVWDAQIRLAEAYIYRGKYALAERIISDLYNDWYKLDDDILRALTMKMDAKLKIGISDYNNAYILLERGAEWCHSKNQYHEEYVFMELLEDLQKKG